MLFKPLIAAAVFNEQQNLFYSINIIYAIYVLLGGLLLLLIHHKLMTKLIFRQITILIISFNQKHSHITFFPSMFQVVIMEPSVAKVAKDSSSVLSGSSLGISAEATRIAR